MWPAPTGAASSWEDNAEPLQQEVQQLAAQHGEAEQQSSLAAATTVAAAGRMPAADSGVTQEGRQGEETHAENRREEREGWPHLLLGGMAERNERTGEAAMVHPVLPALSSSCSAGGHSSDFQASSVASVSSRSMQRTAAATVAAADTFVAKSPAQPNAEAAALPSSSALGEAGWPFAVAEEKKEKQQHQEVLHVQLPEQLPAQQQQVLAQEAELLAQQQWKQAQVQEEETPQQQQQKRMEPPLQRPEAERPQLPERQEREQQPNVEEHQQLQQLEQQQQRQKQQVQERVEAAGELQVLKDQSGVQTGAQQRQQQDQLQQAREEGRLREQEEHGGQDLQAEQHLSTAEFCWKVPDKQPRAAGRRAGGMPAAAPEGPQVVGSTTSGRTARSNTETVGNDSRRKQESSSTSRRGTRPGDRSKSRSSSRKGSNSRGSDESMTGHPATAASSNDARTTEPADASLDAAAADADPLRGSSAAGGRCSCTPRETTARGGCNAGAAAAHAAEEKAKSSSSRSSSSSLPSAAAPAASAGGAATVLQHVESLDEKSFMRPPQAAAAPAAATPGAATPAAAAAGGGGDHTTKAAVRSTPREFFTTRTAAAGDLKERPAEGDACQTPQQGVNVICRKAVRNVAAAAAAAATRRAAVNEAGTAAAQPSTAQKPHAAVVAAAAQVSAAAEEESCAAVAAATAQMSAAVEAVEPHAAVAAAAAAQVLAAVEEEEEHYAAAAAQAPAVYDSDRAAADVATQSLAAGESVAAAGEAVTAALHSCKLATRTTCEDDRGLALASENLERERVLSDALTTVYEMQVANKSTPHRASSTAAAAAAAAAAADAAGSTGILAYADDRAANEGPTTAAAGADTAEAPSRAGTDRASVTAVRAAERSASLGAGGANQPFTDESVHGREILEGAEGNGCAGESASSYAAAAARGSSATAAAASGGGAARPGPLHTGDRRARGCRRDATGNAAKPEGIVVSACWRPQCSAARGSAAAGQCVIDDFSVDHQRADGGAPTAACACGVASGEGTDTSAPASYVAALHSNTVMIVSSTSSCSVGGDGAVAAPSAVLPAAGLSEEPIDDAQPFLSKREIFSRVQQEQQQQQQTAAHYAFASPWRGAAGSSRILQCCCVCGQHVGVPANPLLRCCCCGVRAHLFCLPSGAFAAAVAAAARAERTEAAAQVAADGSCSHASEADAAAQAAPGSALRASEDEKAAAVLRGWPAATAAAAAAEEASAADDFDCSGASTTRRGRTAAQGVAGERNDERAPPGKAKIFGEAGNKHGKGGKRNSQQGDAGVEEEAAAAAVETYAGRTVEEQQHQQELQRRRSSDWGEDKQQQCSGQGDLLPRTRYFSSFRCSSCAALRLFVVQRKAVNEKQQQQRQLSDSGCRVGQRESSKGGGAAIESNRDCCSSSRSSDSVACSRRRERGEEGCEMDGMRMPSPGERSSEIAETSEPNDGRCAAAEEVSERDRLLFGQKQKAEAAEETVAQQVGGGILLLCLLCGRSGGVFEEEATRESFVSPVAGDAEGSSRRCGRNRDRRYTARSTNGSRSESSAAGQSSGLERDVYSSRSYSCGAAADCSKGAAAPAAGPSGACRDAVAAKRRMHATPSQQQQEEENADRRERPNTVPQSQHRGVLLLQSGQQQRQQQPEELHHVLRAPSPLAAVTAPFVESVKLGVHSCCAIFSAETARLDPYASLLLRRRCRSEGGPEKSRRRRSVGKHLLSVRGEGTRRSSPSPDYSKTSKGCSSSNYSCGAEAVASVTAGCSTTSNQSSSSDDAFGQQGGSSPLAAEEGATAAVVQQHQQSISSSSSGEKDKAFEKLERYAARSGRSFSAYMSPYFAPPPTTKSSSVFREAVFLAALQGWRCTLCCGDGGRGGACGAEEERFSSAAAGAHMHAQPGATLAADCGARQTAAGTTAEASSAPLSGAVDSRGAVNPPSHRWTAAERAEGSSPRLDRQPQQQQPQQPQQQVCARRMALVDSASTPLAARCFSPYGWLSAGAAKSCRRVQQYLERGLPVECGYPGCCERLHVSCALCCGGRLQQEVLLVLPSSAAAPPPRRLSTGEASSSSGGCCCCRAVAHSGCAAAQERIQEGLSTCGEIAGSAEMLAPSGPSSGGRCSETWAVQRCGGAVGSSSSGGRQACGATTTEGEETWTGIPELRLGGTTRAAAAAAQPLAVRTVAASAGGTSGEAHGRGSPSAAEDSACSQGLSPDKDGLVRRASGKEAATAAHTHATASVLEGLAATGTLAFSAGDSGTGGAQPTDGSSREAARTEGCGRWRRDTDEKEKPLLRNAHGPLHRPPGRRQKQPLSWLHVWRAVFCPRHARGAAVAAARREAVAAVQAAAAAESRRMQEATVQQLLAEEARQKASAGQRSLKPQPLGLQGDAEGQKGEQRLQLQQQQQLSAEQEKREQLQQQARAACHSGHAVEQQQRGCLPDAEGGVSGGAAVSVVETHGASEAAHHSTQPATAAVPAEAVHVATAQGGAQPLLQGIAQGGEIELNRQSFLHAASTQQDSRDPPSLEQATADACRRPPADLPPHVATASLDGQGGVTASWLSHSSMRLTLKPMHVSEERAAALPTHQQQGDALEERRRRTEAAGSNLFEAPRLQQNVSSAGANSEQQMQDVAVVSPPRSAKAARGPSPPLQQQKRRPPHSSLPQGGPSAACSSGERPSEVLSSSPASPTRQISSMGKPAFTHEGAAAAAGGGGGAGQAAQHSNDMKTNAAASRVAGAANALRKVSSVATSSSPRSPSAAAAAAEQQQERGTADTNVHAAATKGAVLNWHRLDSRFRRVPMGPFAQQLLQLLPPVERPRALVEAAHLQSLLQPLPNMLCVKQLLLETASLFRATIEPLHRGGRPQEQQQQHVRPIVQAEGGGASGTFGEQQKDAAAGTPEPATSARVHEQSIECPAERGGSVLSQYYRSDAVAGGRSEGGGALGAGVTAPTVQAEPTAAVRQQQQQKESQKVEQQEPQQPNVGQAYALAQPLGSGCRGSTKSSNITGTCSPTGVGLAAFSPPASTLAAVGGGDVATASSDAAAVPAVAAAQQLAMAAPLVEGAAGSSDTGIQACDSSSVCHSEEAADLNSRTNIAFHSRQAVEEAYLTVAAAALAESTSSSLLHLGSGNRAGGGTNGGADTSACESLEELLQLHEDAPPLADRVVLQRLLPLLLKSCCGYGGRPPSPTSPRCSSFSEVKHSSSSSFSVTAAADDLTGIKPSAVHQQLQPSNPCAQLLSARDASAAPTDSSSNSCVPDEGGIATAAAEGAAALYPSCNKPALLEGMRLPRRRRKGTLGSVGPESAAPNSSSSNNSSSCNSSRSTSVLGGGTAAESGAAASPAPPTAAVTSSCGDAAAVAAKAKREESDAPRNSNSSSSSGRVIKRPRRVDATLAVASSSSSSTPIGSSGSVGGGAGAASRSASAGGGVCTSSSGRSSSTARSSSGAYASLPAGGEEMGDLMPDQRGSCGVDGAAVAAATAAAAAVGVAAAAAAQQTRDTAGVRGEEGTDEVWWKEDGDSSSSQPREKVVLGLLDFGYSVAYASCRVRRLSASAAAARRAEERRMLQEYRSSSWMKAGSAAAAGAPLRTLLQLGEGGVGDSAASGLSHEQQQQQNGCPSRWVGGSMQQQQLLCDMYEALLLQEEEAEQQLHSSRLAAQGDDDDDDDDSGAAATAHAGASAEEDAEVTIHGTGSASKMHRRGDKDEGGSRDAFSGCFSLVVEDILKLSSYQAAFLRHRVATLTTTCVQPAMPTGEATAAEASAAATSRGCIEISAEEAEAIDSASSTTDTHRTAAAAVLRDSGGGTGVLMSTAGGQPTAPESSPAAAEAAEVYTQMRAMRGKWADAGGSGHHACAQPILQTSSCSAGSSCGPSLAIAALLGRLSDEACCSFFRGSSLSLVVPAPAAAAAAFPAADFFWSGRGPAAAAKPSRHRLGPSSQQQESGRRLALPAADCYGGAACGDGAKTSAKDSLAAADAILRSGAAVRRLTVDFGAAPSVRDLLLRQALRARTLQQAVIEEQQPRQQEEACMQREVSPRSKAGSCGEAQQQVAEAPAAAAGEHVSAADSSTPSRLEDLGSCGLPAATAAALRKEIAVSRAAEGENTTTDANQDYGSRPSESEQTYVSPSSPRTAEAVRDAAAASSAATTAAAAPASDAPGAAEAAAGEGVATSPPNNSSTAAVGHVLAPSTLPPSASSQRDRDRGSRAASAAANAENDVVMVGGLPLLTPAAAVAAATATVAAMARGHEANFFFAQDARGRQITRRSYRPGEKLEAAGDVSLEVAAGAVLERLLQRPSSKSRIADAVEEEDVVGSNFAATYVAAALLQRTLVNLKGQLLDRVEEQSLLQPARLSERLGLQQQLLHSYFAYTRWTQLMEAVRRGYRDYCCSACSGTCDLGCTGRAKSSSGRRVALQQQGDAQMLAGTREQQTYFAGGLDDGEADGCCASEVEDIYLDSSSNSSSSGAAAAAGLPSSDAAAGALGIIRTPRALGLGPSAGETSGVGDGRGAATQRESSRRARANSSSRQDDVLRRGGSAYCSVCWTRQQTHINRLLRCACCKVVVHRYCYASSCSSALVLGASRSTSSIGTLGSTSAAGGESGAEGPSSSGGPSSAVAAATGAYHHGGGGGAGAAAGGQDTAGSSGVHHGGGGGGGTSSSALSLNIGEDWLCGRCEREKKLFGLQQQRQHFAAAMTVCCICGRSGGALKAATFRERIRLVPASSRLAEPSSPPPPQQDQQQQQRTTSMPADNGRRANSSRGPSGSSCDASRAAGGALAAEDEAAEAFSAARPTEKNNSRQGRSRVLRGAALRSAMRAEQALLAAGEAGGGGGGGRGLTRGSAAGQVDQLQQQVDGERNGSEATRTEGSVNANSGAAAAAQQEGGGSSSRGGVGRCGGEVQEASAVFEKEGKKTADRGKAAAAGGNKSSNRDKDDDSQQGWCWRYVDRGDMVHVMCALWLLPHACCLDYERLEPWDLSRLQILKDRRIAAARAAAQRQQKAAAAAATHSLPPAAPGSAAPAAATVAASGAAKIKRDARQSGAASRSRSPADSEASYGVSASACRTPSTVKPLASGSSSSRHQRERGGGASSLRSSKRESVSKCGASAAAAACGSVVATPTAPASAANSRRASTRVAGVAEEKSSSGQQLITGDDGGSAGGAADPACCWTGEASSCAESGGEYNGAAAAEPLGGTDTSSGVAKPAAAAGLRVKVEDVGAEDGMDKPPTRKATARGSASSCSSRRTSTVSCGAAAAAASGAAAPLLGPVLESRTHPSDVTAGAAEEQQLQGPSTTAAGRLQLGRHSSIGSCSIDQNAFHYTSPDAAAAMPRCIVCGLSDGFLKRCAARHCSVGLFHPYCAWLNACRVKVEFVPAAAEARRLVKRRKEEAAAASAAARKARRRTSVGTKKAAAPGPATGYVREDEVAAAAGHRGEVCLPNVNCSKSDVFCRSARAAEEEGKCGGAAAEETVAASPGAGSSLAGAGAARGPKNVKREIEAHAEEELGEEDSEGSATVDSRSRKGTSSTRLKRRSYAAEETDEDYMSELSSSDADDGGREKSWVWGLHATSSSNWLDVEKGTVNGSAAVAPQESAAAPPAAHLRAGGSVSAAADSAEHANLAGEGAAAPGAGDTAAAAAPTGGAKTQGGRGSAAEPTAAAHQRPRQTSARWSNENRVAAGTIFEKGCFARRLLVRVWCPLHAEEDRGTWLPPRYANQSAAKDTLATAQVYISAAANAADQLRYRALRLALSQAPDAPPQKQRSTHGGGGGAAARGTTAAANNIGAAPAAASRPKRAAAGPSIEEGAGGTVSAGAARATEGEAPGGAVSAAHSASSAVSLQQQEECFSAPRRVCSSTAAAAASSQSGGAHGVGLRDTKDSSRAAATGQGQLCSATTTTTTTMGVRSVSAAEAAAVLEESAGHTKAAIVGDGPPGARGGRTTSDCPSSSTTGGGVKEETDGRLSEQLDAFGHATVIQAAGEEAGTSGSSLSGHLWEGEGGGGEAVSSSVGPGKAFEHVFPAGRETEMVTPAKTQQQQSLLPHERQLAAQGSQEQDRRAITGVKRQPTAAANQEHMPGGLLGLPQVDAASTMHFVDTKLGGGVRAAVEAADSSAETTAVCSSSASHIDERVVCTDSTNEERVKRYRETAEVQQQRLLYTMPHRLDACAVCSQTGEPCVAAAISPLKKRGKTTSNVHAAGAGGGGNVNCLSGTLEGNGTGESGGEAVVVTEEKPAEAAAKSAEEDVWGRQRRGWLYACRGCGMRVHRECYGGRGYRLSSAAAAALNRKSREKQQDGVQTAATTNECASQHFLHSSGREPDRTVAEENAAAATRAADGSGLVALPGGRRSGGPTLQEATQARARSMKMTNSKHAERGEEHRRGNTKKRKASTNDLLLAGTFQCDACAWGVEPAKVQCLLCHRSNGALKAIQPLDSAAAWRRLHEQLAEQQHKQQGLDQPQQQWGKQQEVQRVHEQRRHHEEGVQHEQGLLGQKQVVACSPSKDEHSQGGVGITSGAAIKTEAHAGRIGATTAGALIKGKNSQWRHEPRFVHMFCALHAPSPPVKITYNQQLSPVWGVDLLAAALAAREKKQEAFLEAAFAKLTAAAAATAAGPSPKLSAPSFCSSLPALAAASFSGGGSNGDGGGVRASHLRERTQKSSVENPTHQLLFNAADTQLSTPKDWLPANVKPQHIAVYSGQEPVARARQLLERTARAYWRQFACCFCGRTKGFMVRCSFFHGLLRASPLLLPAAFSYRGVTKKLLPAKPPPGVGEMILQPECAHQRQKHEQTTSSVNSGIPCVAEDKIASFCKRKTVCFSLRGEKQEALGTPSRHQKEKRQHHQPSACTGISIQADPGGLEAPLTHPSAIPENGLLLAYSSAATSSGTIAVKRRQQGLEEDEELAISSDGCCEKQFHPICGQLCGARFLRVREPAAASDEAHTTAGGQGLGAAVSESFGGVVTLFLCRRHSKHFDKIFPEALRLIGAYRTLLELRATLKNVVYDEQQKGELIRLQKALQQQAEIHEQLQLQITRQLQRQQQHRQQQHRQQQHRQQQHRQQQHRQQQHRQQQH